MKVNYNFDLTVKEAKVLGGLVSNFHRVEPIPESSGGYDPSEWMFNETYSLVKNCTRSISILKKITRTLDDTLARLHHHMKDKDDYIIHFVISDNEIEVLRTYIIVCNRCKELPHFDKFFKSCAEEAHTSILPKLNLL